MIEATLRSDDPERAAQLRNLRISLEEPLASQIIGEVGPRRTRQSGQREVLSLFLKPLLGNDHQGFDLVLVELPPGIEAELVDARVGSESELAEGGGKLYGPDELERFETGADSLWIRLPEPVRDSQQLVELRFSSVLYLVSHEFIALVGMGEDEGERIWQRVDAGDATSLLAGSGMTVQSPVDVSLIGGAESLHPEWRRHQRRGGVCLSGVQDTGAKGHAAGGVQPVGPSAAEARKPRSECCRFPASSMGRPRRQRPARTAWFVYLPHRYGGGCRRLWPVDRDQADLPRLLNNSDL